MTAAKNTLIVVAGPTAVGKSDVAVALAKQYDTAILSVDARQCFKEMSIGTAKPPSSTLQEIPHFFKNRGTKNFSKQASTQCLIYLTAKYLQCASCNGGRLFTKRTLSILTRTMRLTRSTM